MVIQLNVNHTVDSAEPDDGSQEAPEMRSKPNFEVDLVKGKKTLSFSCSFIPEEMEHEGKGQEEYSKAAAFIFRFQFCRTFEISYHKHTILKDPWLFK